MSWVCPRVIGGNRGDLLSRWGILSELSRLAEPERLEVVTEYPEDLPPDVSCRVLPCGRLYNLIPANEGWKSLRRAEAVFWTGGLDLQDDSSRARLMHLLLMFIFIHQECRQSSISTVHYKLFCLIEKAFNSDFRM